MDYVPTNENKKRLLVLIPDCLAGNSDLAHKIYWMAIRDHCDVLLLALVDDVDEMLSVSRGMATMAAIISNNHINVDSKLTETKYWLKTLRTVHRSGDIVVCHEEQSVDNGFLRTTPLKKFIQNNLKMSISTLSGFYHPWQVQIKIWLHNLLFWAGCLVIIAFFTVLEILIDRDFLGITRTGLFLIALFFELGIIMTWNNFQKTK